jgi:hypothetical protein
VKDKVRIYGKGSYSIILKWHRVERIKHKEREEEKEK